MYEFGILVPLILVCKCRCLNTTQSSDGLENSSIFVLWVACRKTTLNLAAQQWDTNLGTDERWKSREVFGIRGCFTEMISYADQSCLKPAFPICIAQPKQLSVCTYEAHLCTPEGVFPHKYSSGYGCGSGPLSATSMNFFAYTQLLL